MPSVKDKSTVDAIAREFTSNGRDKGKALRTIGYSRNYSEHAGLKLFDTVRLKAAIAAIDAKTAQKAEYTIDQYQRELESARQHAEKLNQPSAEVSAVVAKGRSCGFDKDATADKADVAIPLTDEQVAKAKAAALAVTYGQLTGPRLHREGA